LLVFIVLAPHGYAALIDVPPPGELPVVNTVGNDTFYAFIADLFLRRVKPLLSAVAVFYIIYYGSRMALASGNEDSVKKSKLAIMYALIGFIILNAPAIFIQAFNPASQPILPEGPSIEWWAVIMDILITGLRYIAGIIAVAWLILSGFRMITAAGKEDVISKHRIQILWSIFGLIIVALAGVFEKIAFGDCNWSTLICSYPNPTEGVSVFVSIINMILTFVVPLGLIFLVVGGMYMILAHGNDTMLTKGKKILQYTVIALVIIYISYVVVAEIAKW
jgi:hypothetical protein